MNDGVGFHISEIEFMYKCVCNQMLLLKGDDYKKALYIRMKLEKIIAYNKCMQSMIKLLNYLNDEEDDEDG